MQTSSQLASVSAETRRHVDAFMAGRHGLLIDGRWVEAQSGETFATHDPANGREIARVASAGRGDVERAVAAARRALEEGPWPRMTPAERARLIWRLADAIEASAEEFALIETLDNGKPLRDARAMDIPHAIELFRYNAGWATKLNGETVRLSRPGSWHAYTTHEPIGVVGQIVPWNAPLMMTATKMAPALAAGCTIVLKPAEQTPMSALRLGHLIAEVGFPDGVVNILTGFGETAGAGISEHPGVDKITFTGSTEVGRIIVRAAAATFKRVTLELGGKSPVIVFPDADVKKAIEGASRSIFGSTGQVCNAGSRLYAHRSVFDEVVDGIARRAEAIRIGPGIDPGTEMGPVISLEQKQRIEGYLASGRRQGAHVRAGGEAPDGEGYFVRPTVLTETTAGMDVVREEIFGPVLCAMTFEDADLDRIAREANATQYGLGAVLWTNNLSVAHSMAARIKAGTVRVNGSGLDPALPFGGFKNSGWGREYGREGVEAYTELKSVAIAL